jgi:hypothetical protein
MRAELEMLVGSGINVGEVTTNAVAVAGSAVALEDATLVASDNTLACGGVVACGCQLHAITDVRKTMTHTAAKPVLPLLWL